MRVPAGLAKNWLNRAERYEHEACDNQAVPENQPH
jgi:hypothetical protein